MTGKNGIIYPTNTAKIELYPAAEAEMKSVAHVEIAPDQQEHDVTLKAIFSGLHRIEVSDQHIGTNVLFPADLPMTIVSS